jgi:VanZ family protein
MEGEFIKPVSVGWWAITLAWAALIFYLSSQTFSPNFSRGLLVWTLQLLHLRVSAGTFRLLHAYLRGLAHVTEYAIFALLLYGFPGGKFAGGWQSRRALFCILVAAAYSLTDEFHQLFVPGRHASLFDCGLDTIGATLAMLGLYIREQMSLLKSSKVFSKGSCPTGNEIAS